MSKKSPTYKGSPRGSQWHKWDLHVHTPASVEQHFGDSQQEKVWEKYINALESLPIEIKAIGINDYFMLDGYRHIQKAKNSGRLQNIELILPVVEFRLKQLAGHKKLQRINYHVIFSDDLSADEIEARFLNKLAITFKLKDGEEHTVLGCDRDSLTDLGEAILRNTPEEKRGKISALRTGFANAVFSLEDMQKLCGQSIFTNKIVTALGITEWDDMRFDGGGTGIKRNLINGTDLVFVASPNVESYRKRRQQLIAAEVNNRLLDCSDSHHYADSAQPMRLGNVLSWIKADLTFGGLQRAILCFDDRVEVLGMGSAPIKLTTVQSQKGKFIEKIVIKKNKGSDLDEKWFDCEVPLNTDLVAIIGNQGGGKSALTDIIALCGNTKTTDFSFLNQEKFRDRDHKASEFTATLYWIDGTSKCRMLDEDIGDTEIERVRYVPQHFFETVTNETAVKQKGQFYSEVKKVIFSHIDKSDRMNCPNLDSLVELWTQEIENFLVTLRQELSEVNRHIVESEKACSADSIERLKNQIESKEQEIATHRLARPNVVAEPADSTKANKKIKALRNQENELEETLSELHIRHKDLKQRRMIVNQKRQAIETEQRRIQKFVDELQSTFDKQGIDLRAEDIISISINLNVLDEERKGISTELGQIAYNTDENEPDSLAYQKLTLSSQRKELQAELEQGSQVYQQYVTNEQERETKLTSLIGDAKTADSLDWLRQKLRAATEDLPKELQALYLSRQEKTKAIHLHLWKLANVYQELTQAVRDYIDADELTRDRYRLQFTIQLTEQGFADHLFSMIKFRSSFAGRDEGRQRMDSLIEGCDFSSFDETMAFVEDLLARLEKDHRSTSPAPDDINKMLRTNHHLRDLYDYIFGLEYLNPQYSMILNGKPLRKLSPGERGVLLLVFYLVIDQRDEPLIIDQPEGNLNNQAIFDHLVPVFKEAKKQRQIIVVTHNPNLAIVSDAEQIIHARIDSADANKVHFQSGAIENPAFTSLTVDVLEGTPPAFRARHKTYGEIL